VFNFGDMLDIVERNLPPDAPLCLHGDRRIDWGEAGRLSNNLARSLREGGLKAGDSLAIYLRNGPEYILGLAAAFKARLAAVNVNYRYTDAELRYLLNDSDARAVVYAAEFRDHVEAIRADLPLVTRWIEVTDGAPAPGFAEDFAVLTQSGDGAPLDIERSPNDIVFIYTGGTTGMPKGVMWEHGELREILVSAARALQPVPDTPDELAASIRELGPGPRILPACPLMHGTGLLPAIATMVAGGSIVTLAHRSFDAREAIEAIERHRPQALVIVGDSFGRPLLAELEGGAQAHDLGSVLSVTSSGVMWSADIKRGLLRHMPDAVLNDVLSSSEALGLGASVMTRDCEVKTASFTLGERCRVFDETDRPVLAGSGGVGRLALGPPNPLGYYRDAEKSAATFRVIDGVRYCIPGDWVRVEADGSLTFLGRGSGCINTGGEKVFAEEVEEALKRHDSVSDALVVGVPDPTWGQAIVGVVTLHADAAFDAEALRDHVRAQLAGYKVPKRLLVADRPLRAANGKADYGAARAIAEGATAR
jgi:fatty-acyl-CoA synthase